MRNLRKVVVPVAILGLFGWVGGAWAAPVGFVMGVEGTAQVQAAAGKAPQKLALDGQVSVGDTLQTESRSSLKVLLEDDTVLFLGPDTQVVIDRLVLGDRASKERSIIRETRGHLRVNVGRVSGGTRLEVHTPTALLNARGTVVEVVTSRASGGVETLAVCLDGVLTARNLDRAVPGSVEVPAGMSTLIRRGKPPTPPALPPANFHALAGAPARGTLAEKGTSAVLGDQEDKAFVEATESRLLKRKTLDATNVVGKSIGPEEVFEGGARNTRAR